jgi:putative Mn2+ efflux pump MntP
MTMAYPFRPSPWLRAEPALTHDGRRLVRLSFDNLRAGRTVEVYIREVDHWVAFGLLAFVGGKMLWEARHEADVRPGDPTRGWMLLVLSVATSIDALAVGLSMAFLHVSIWLPSVAIGLVAFTFTATGILLGSRIGRTLGRWPEVVGGLVLLGIGAKILAEHMAG